jgi:hypothetical protein
MPLPLSPLMPVAGRRDGHTPSLGCREGLVLGLQREELAPPLVWAERKSWYWGHGEQEGWPCPLSPSALGGLARAVLVSSPLGVGAGEPAG